MTKSLRKNIFREIRHTWKRFLSIALMAFLGAGFFAGINACSTDMQLACDTYLDTQNCYDLEVMSTLGLTEDDVAALLRVRGISSAVGTYSENVMVDIADGEEKIAVQSLPLDSDINQLYLVDGKIAEQANECVVPQSLLDITGKQLGDTLCITETLEKDEESSFLYTELTITGVVDSPLYIYRTSGTNERSTGAVADYLYVPDSNITEDYYTEIYLTVQGAAELDCFSDAYEQLIADEEALVKAIADDRGQARYDQLTGDANEEIDDAQQELDEKQAEAQKELDDAQAEIDDARQQIADGRAELENSRLQAERELAQAQETLDSGAQQLAAARAAFQQQEAAAKTQRASLVQKQQETDLTLTELKQKQEETAQTLSQLRTQSAQVTETINELTEQREQAEETLAGLNAQKETLTEAITQYTAALETMQTQLTALQTAREEQAKAGGDTSELDAQLSALTAQLTQTETEKAAYEAQLQQLEEGIAQAEDGIAQLDDGIAQAQSALEQLTDGIAQAESGLQQIADGIVQAESGLQQIEDGIAQIDDGLESGRAQLLQAQQELEDGRLELAAAKSSAYAQLAEAEQMLEESEAELEDGAQELAVQRADFDREIADAQKEIDEAREEAGDINLPTWYVLTREGNTGISSFHQDSANLKKIGFTFPMIFFLVAVLISLSSMTRMVEEQRSLIGTFKALGYSGGQITAKYLIYAGTATISGAIIGEYICLKALPEIVWIIYQNFYQIPIFSTPIDWFYGTIGLVVCAGCIIGATAAACRSAVRQTPASLMRPKAPNPGKRVFLEYITPLWKRMSFSYKVTTRNLFRYKKRFFMTICGIAGCAALITTGFGLRDSIMTLVPLQFDGIMHYDMLAIAAADTSETAYEELYTELQEDGQIQDALQLHEESVKLVTDNNASQELELFVPLDADHFDEYISLIDTESEETWTLPDDGILLTEQVAELLDTGAGDTISLRREDGSKIDVTVCGIVHNYLSHYAFLSAAGYQKLFGETADGNAFLLHSSDLSQDESNAFLKELNSDTRFSTVSDTKAARDAVDDRFGMLDQVVYILIGAAAALAIVVLYNLSNINISERIRELATIKVLGFYDMEVYQYNTRENIVLTFLGTVVGLIGGRYLTAFLLKTMEMRGIVFVPTVALKSYALAAMITVVFSLVINIGTYFTLRKINMVEALKSVE